MVAKIFVKEYGISNSESQSIEDMMHGGLFSSGGGLFFVQSNFGRN